MPPCSGSGTQPLSGALYCSDLRVDSQKQRHPSGGVSVSSEMVCELEGVELGADGKARADAVHTGRQAQISCLWRERAHEVVLSFDFLKCNGQWEQAIAL